MVARSNNSFSLFNIANCRSIQNPKYKVGWYKILMQCSRRSVKIGWSYAVTVLHVAEVALTVANVVDEDEEGSVLQ